MKTNENGLDDALKIEVEKQSLVVIGKVNSELASRFDIRQPVYYADLNWDLVLASSGKRVQFKEIPKYPVVERDLAIVVPKGMKYQEIQSVISNLKLNKLKQVQLFDVFESDKLGAGKKSMAVNFTFLDEEKTLTDNEIDSWMNKIMNTLTKDLEAEIRK